MLGHGHAIAVQEIGFINVSYVLIGFVYKISQGHSKCCLCRIKQSLVCQNLSLLALKKLASGCKKHFLWYHIH